MSEKLKPCPFCGETPDADNPDTFQMPETSKYGAVVCCCYGPDVRTSYQDVEHWRDDAIAAWNERAEDPRLAEVPNMVAVLRELADAAQGMEHWPGGQGLHDPLDEARAILARIDGEKT